MKFYGLLPSQIFELIDRFTLIELNFHLSSCCCIGITEC